MLPGRPLSIPHDRASRMPSRSASAPAGRAKVPASPSSGPSRRRRRRRAGPCGQVLGELVPERLLGAPAHRRAVAAHLGALQRGAPAHDSWTRPPPLSGAPPPRARTRHRDHDRRFLWEGSARVPGGAPPKGIAGAAAHGDGVFHVDEVRPARQRVGKNPETNAPGCAGGAGSPAGHRAGAFKGRAPRPTVLALRDRARRAGRRLRPAARVLHHFQFACHCSA